MKAILAGYGEIGKGVFEVFKDYHQIEPNDPDKGIMAPDGQYDVLLVAIPYFDNFIDIVNDYQQKYGVKSTIIFSTVAIGTSAKLAAAHCPVEGKHPDLAESIRISEKWLGGKDELALKFLKDADFNVINLEKPEYTEFLKLRSTTVYGVNIEFARYSKKVCDALGLNYDEVKKWDGWVNNIYHHFGMGWAIRYTLDAPQGAKGGHCVTPNAKILNKQYPDKMVEIVAEEGAAGLQKEREWGAISAVAETQSKEQAKEAISA